MRIALSAGHHPGSPGATYNGYKEHNEAARWCAIIGHMLMDAGIIVHHITTGTLPSKVSEVKALHHASALDLAVELHFNACGGCGAEGSETLYYPHASADSKGRKAAEIMQRELAMAGAKDRGVKAGWHRLNPENGPNYWLANTPCPAVIVEPAFLDGEFPMGTQEERSLCWAIANGIAEFCHE